MADAATAGAPAATVPEPTGTTGTKSGTGTGQPTAAQVAKWKADLGDGEKEYDSKYLSELAKRGKSSAQTISLAERRLQEATAKEKAAEERIAAFKSGDLKRIRATLKEMGVDERALTNEVGRDLLEDMEAEKDPTRKALRDAQRKLQEVEGEKSKAAKEQQAKADAEEMERHQNELGELFTSVMERTGLPRESAAAVFPRLARLYAAVEGNGGKVDPDLAAVRVEEGLRSEHKALFYGKDGKLNVEAVKSIFGDEGFAEIRRHAVAEWRAKHANGAPMAPSTQQRPPQQQEEQPKRGGNFWKHLEQRMKS